MAAASFFLLHYSSGSWISSKLQASTPAAGHPLSIKQLTNAHSGGGCCMIFAMAIHNNMLSLPEPPFLRSPCPLGLLSTTQRAFLPARMDPGFHLVLSDLQHGPKLYASARNLNGQVARVLKSRPPIPHFEMEYYGVWLHEQGMSSPMLCL